VFGPYSDRYRAGSVLSVSHQVTIRVGGRDVVTLGDILPAEGPMKMLMIAKTPALASVDAGHYFQGRQGRMFWNRLSDHGLLNVLPPTFEDDALLDHGYGLTDIVKVPRDYGNEPSDDEYRDGLQRILDLVEELEPQVLLFVYKRVLDQILRLSFNRREKSTYGFNDDLNERFDSRVFVFPMPGTPCTSAQAITAMTELAQLLR
jgi:G:T/U-mismatch repair DNA glycosylase